MTLDTAQKMYKYFLTEVRKERTVVVTPGEWTSFVGPVLIDWVKTKLPEREFNQKRIDDLESIKVLTDGFQWPRIESLYASGNIFKIPYDDNTLPKYMFGLAVAFGNGISQVGPPDPGDGGASVLASADSDNPKPGSISFKLQDRVGAKMLRSDKRVLYSDNPYRKPIDTEFVYFEQRGNYIYCHTAKQQYNRMELEYYRYPTEIVFDGSIDNAGSFMPQQNKEIMDMAVTRYLERVSDQRIQTQPSVSASVPK